MKAFYAGTFDPFTIGHLSMARRALGIFDELVIAVGYNPSKNTSGSLEERLKNISRIFKDDKRVNVVAYEGLTANAAKDMDAGVLVRGVRNGIDFEKEKALADINLKVFGMPTIMLPCDPSLSFVSSSMVRELQHFGEDVSPFLPGNRPENNTKEI